MPRGDDCFICKNSTKNKKQSPAVHQCADCSRWVCRHHAREWRGNTVCRDDHWIRHRRDRYTVLMTPDLPEDVCWVCFYFRGHHIHSHRDGVKFCYDCGRPVCINHQRVRYPVPLDLCCYLDRRDAGLRVTNPDELVTC